ncbi:PepSY domain-containing protein [Planococcus sp. YIM B11945]|uniref:PepSY domain-containing protein n=1 Tax=Planococcus sp. YIM B11945 TaxID=3435410 RepID=UPI003D7EFBCD
MRKGLLMAGATVFLGGAMLLFVLNQPTGADELSRAEAEAKVADMYGGDIAETRSAGSGYEITFDREDGRYAAIINKKTEHIESVKLLEKIEVAETITEEEAAAIAAKEAEGKLQDVVYSKEQNEFQVTIAGAEKVTAVVVAADTGEVQSITEKAKAPETEDGPGRIISEKEAVEIAKKTLDGEASDVEFVDTEDGGYYLVDIEKDETDQEVRVQIHAVRGETMTVEWDD